MNIVHLTASPFFGGPERQMLGLGRTLPPEYRSIYVSFSEKGAARPFLERARQEGFTAIELRWNWPRVRRSVQELTALLREQQADILCCHSYKADLLGWLAARRAGVPIIGVSRGWTGCTWRVKLYDFVDGLSLRWMDAVVCVSEGQAVKVRRFGVAPSRLHVIRNAIRTERFANPDPSYRQKLERLFPVPVRHIVGAAGRLSPEKGFDQLVTAAVTVGRERPDVGIVIFGAGPRHESLQEQITRLGVKERVILAGFRSDLDAWIPALDALTLPSYTEGLPNVVLEAFAARVPVVATPVAGTPEVVDEGVSGYLVPPGDAAALARRLLDLLSDEQRRIDMGQRGYQKVQREFTFTVQAQKYQELFAKVVGGRCASGLPLRRHQESTNIHAVC